MTKFHPNQKTNTKNTQKTKRTQSTLNEWNTFMAITIIFMHFAAGYIYINLFMLVVSPFATINKFYWSTVCALFHCSLKIELFWCSLWIMLCHLYMFAIVLDKMRIDKRQKKKRTTNDGMGIRASISITTVENEDTAFT